MRRRTAFGIMEAVEIAAALIAFMTLVVAWLACPATSEHAVEPVEERAA